MITITSTPNPAITTATPLVANGTPSATTTPSLGSLSFGDIVDALNPLQHIPIVSGALRAATGSTISPVSEIAGDALYGTLTGSAAVSIASSVGDVAVTEITGKSIGQNVLSAINGLSSPSSTPASTPLVADSPIVSQLIAASQPATQSPSSANTVVASANSPSAFFKAMQQGTSSGAAQYQRAQILDNANKMLLTMAV